MLVSSICVVYLIEEQLSALLLPQVHHLHRHLSPAMSLSGDADHPRGPFPNLYEVLQICPRVTRVHHHLQRPLKLLVSHLHASVGYRLLSGRGAEMAGGVSRGAGGGGAGL